MTCLVCQHWDVKATPSEMRRHGLALCAKGKRWEFMSPLSCCPKFEEVSAETKEKRVEWARQKRLM